MKTSWQGSTWKVDSPLTVSLKHKSNTHWWHNSEQTNLSTKVSSLPTEELLQKSLR